MTQPNLDELRGLLAKATPGPWSVCTDATGDTFVASMTDSAETVCELGAGDDDESQSHLDADATLIVAAVNYLPALIAEVERLWGEGRDLLDMALDLTGQIPSAAATLEGN